MSIIIPSKNIYSKNNEKVRNNIIDNVKVDTTVVEKANGYGVQVYGKQDLVEWGDYWDGEEFSSEKSNVEYNVTGSPLVYYYSATYAKIVGIVGNQGEVKIPIVENNSFVEKILTGIDKNGNSNIKYRVIGKKTTGDITAYFEGRTFKSVSESNTKVEKDISYTFDDMKRDQSDNNPLVAKAYQPSSVGLWLESSVEVSLPTVHTHDVAVPSKETIDGKEYWVFPSDGTKNFLHFLLGFYRAEAAGREAIEVTAESQKYQITGNFVEFEPTDLEVSIYGNTIGINLKDGSVTYGEGNRPHSLNGNELLQETTKTNEVPTSQYLAERVLESYREGKETATLLCSIGDYYEYDETSEDKKGDLKITTNPKEIKINARVVIEPHIDYPNSYSYYMDVNLDETLDKDVEVNYAFSIGIYNENKKVTIKSGRKSVYVFLCDSIGYLADVEKFEYSPQKTKSEAKMCFRVGDEVIPMVFGVTGKDAPMSKYSNGTPKVFRVIGTKMYYDGAVWQELTLQEV